MCGSHLAVCGLEGAEHAAGRAAAHVAAVDGNHRRQLAHGARGEDLVSGMELCKRHAPLDDGDAEIFAEIDDRLARDAGKACVRMGCGYNAPSSRDEWMGDAGMIILGDTEEVGGVGFGYKTFDVEHDGVGGTSVVGLDFGENVVDQVAVMDLAVDALCRVATISGCN